MAIKHEEILPGYTMTIEAEEFPQSPNEWGNTDAFLVGYDDRYFWVFRDGFEWENVRAALCGGKCEDGDEHRRGEEIRKEYRMYEVNGYVHGGVAVHLGDELKQRSIEDAYDMRAPFGVVFMSRKDYKSAKHAKEVAKSIVNEWSEYLGGEVYEYSVEDPEGKTIARCGGYFRDEGIKQAREDALAEARRAKLTRDAARERAALKASGTEVDIYDTGNTGMVDRYTILDHQDEAAYGMSEDPKSPQGFNQYLGDPAKLNLAALGKKCTFASLPETVREAILDRLVEYSE